jgi:hypothetical protein
MRTNKRKDELKYRESKQQAQSFLAFNWIGKRKFSITQFLSFLISAFVAFWVLGLYFLCHTMNNDRVYFL